MKFVLMPNFQKKNAFETAQKTIEILCGLGCDVYTDNENKTIMNDRNDIKYGQIDEISKQADFIIAIGGDGTILNASTFASVYDKPLLGINTGRIGFMASMESDELDDLSKLITGDYTIVNRMMLNTEIISQDNGVKYTALNDIVISSPYSKLTDYNVFIDNKLVSTIRADGIVFSTPTGSTAYALSAGGPIVEPKMKCIQLTPICPQSLCSRTMLFSADNVLEVQFVAKKSNEVAITIDGKKNIKLNFNNKILISESHQYLKLIDIKGNCFFDAVNNKLMNSIKG